MNYREIINSCVWFQLIRFRRSPVCVTSWLSYPRGSAFPTCTSAGQGWWRRSLNWRNDPWLLFCSAAVHIQSVVQKKLHLSVLLVRANIVFCFQITESWDSLIEPRLIVEPPVNGSGIENGAVWDVNTCKYLCGLVSWEAAFQFWGQQVHWWLFFVHGFKINTVFLRYGFVLIRECFV